MSTRLGRAARELAAASPTSRAYAAALALAIAAGTVFRLAGAFTAPLWGDEARQAIALGGELSLDGLAAWPLHLRPIGFLLLGKLSILVHDAEWVLRATSFVPSIAALFATLALARLAFTSRAAVLVCVLCVALNPWLIDYAKEYKPYALEHLLITAQGYLALRWLQQRHARSLRAFAAIAVVSPLLGFACVFVEPFLFALLAVDAWRRRDRRALALVAAAGAAAVALFAAQYLLFQHHATRMSFRYWWTNFYDTEFAPARLAVHAYDITGRFAAGPVFWGAWPAGLLAALNAVLFAAGVAALVARRRWTLLIFIAGPLLLPIAASFAGRWPYGMVRVNLYMVGLVVLAWGAAVDGAASSRRLRWAGLATAGLIAALQLPLAPRLVLAKQIPEAFVGPTLRALDMPALLDRVIAADAGGADAAGAGDAGGAGGAPVGDAPSCVHVSAEARPLYLYYTQHHDPSAAARAARLRVGRLLSENTRYTMLEMSAALRGEAQPCWLIRSYKYDEQLAAKRTLREPGFRVLAEVEAAGLTATKIARELPRVTAGPDGAIALRGEDAVLLGDGLWFHGKPRIGGLQGVDPRWGAEAIGNWTSPAQVVRWSFDAARAGEVEVLVSQAAGEGAPASEYVVEVAGQVLRGIVQRTPSWHEFATVRLGAITLAPGAHTLAVRPVVRRGEHVMNLRAITLRPRR